MVARLQIALKAGQRSFWFAHQPPQIHLALITHIDLPFALARLRVPGQLSEIRAHDLRFAVDEARQISTKMGAGHFTG